MGIPKLRAPVVLVHGLMGFDCLRVGKLVLADYFPGAPEILGGAGVRFRVARLSPVGGIAERADQLKALIERAFPKESVHVIGHSMGGLDARYMISRLGMASRVLSLTTLGTPHRGSSLADWGMKRIGPLVRPALDCLGLTYQAFQDLTVASCRRFNDEVPDAPGVRYFSVAARLRQGWGSPQWQLPARILGRAEGPNDGVVSVASARYGEAFDEWDGDHLTLVNWRHPSHRDDPADLPRYARVLRRLADAE
jgi:triacylglycerol lipase